ncbi:MAG TPA: hypothetical protein VGH20_05425 [Myxococcales bacterium]|jgi:hypothetical protein
MPRRTLWFFQRTGPGEIKRISNPSMQRFLVGERAMPHDGDGFVRCIGMSLEMHNKKPATVSRVWFSKIRVRDDGTVDPHHRHETAKLARSEAIHLAQAESSVVVAGHRFAERRLSHLGEWRPEQRDLDALRAEVNTKAGKEML